MKKKFSKVSLVLGVTLLVGGCTAVSSKYSIPPNGGAAIKVAKPVWITGTYRDDMSFSSKLPIAQENEYLKVVNAGYWLANANGKVSQLVYAFDLSIKKPISDDKVYTKVILENPADTNTSIIYKHYLNTNERSTHVTHAIVQNVKLGDTYHMIFEVYSDANRTKLLTKIDQPIVSLADNTSGCLELSEDVMQVMYSNILDPHGKVIPIDKLIFACEKGI
jgi:hypothetical protein